MESLERRLQLSLEKVGKLVHEELAALLSEAAKSPVDLSHPQFGAVASRVARLSSSVENVYRQAAIELIMPHLQFEDVDAQARLVAVQPGDHRLGHGAEGGGKAISPAGQDIPGFMARSQSSATRLLSQCTQEGLSMHSSEDAGDGSTNLQQHVTSSADRLRKLTPHPEVAASLGHSGSLPRATSALGGQDSEGAAKRAAAMPNGRPMQAGEEAAEVTPSKSQPLQPSASGNHTSITSLSSPTGGSTTDAAFNGLVVQEQSMQATAQATAAAAAGGQEQMATQEYLKSVHAALTAANLVMGDASAITNLQETLQRAAQMKRDASAPGTASQQASGKLMQLVGTTRAAGQGADTRPISPYMSGQQDMSMESAGIVVGNHALETPTSGSLQTRASLMTGSVGSAGGGVSMNRDQVQQLAALQGQYLEEQQALHQQQQGLREQQQQQVVLQQQALQQQQQVLHQQQQALQQQQQQQQAQQQYVLTEVQRLPQGGYTTRGVSTSQLQVPMENLVLSSHRPTHGNASHGLQLVDMYGNAAQNNQNMLALNAAGVITTMADNGPAHTMSSGPLPVIQGDTLLMEPLTSYVPDPNFSLFDLQATSSAQHSVGFNPPSAPQPLSMYAAAANADGVQVRPGLAGQGQIDLQGQGFTTLGLGSVGLNSAGQLINIGAGNSTTLPGTQLTLQHDQGVHSEPLPLLVNLNQGQTINLAGLQLSNAHNLGMGLGAVPQRAGITVGNLGGLNVGLGGVPVSPLPLRVQDLPGRFKILPVVVQQRILALCRTNPVIGVRDFDDKVVSKLSLLVDSWGVEQALAMLDHLEHRMRTKQGAMKNGPGYLDVAVCSHLDMLKAQGACPKSMKLEDYAAQVLAPPVYHELCQAVTTNRWLAWEHFDQGIVQLIKKLPTESAVEKLQEITYHSFKNVDNIKGCIMSILNSKIREDRRRQ